LAQQWPVKALNFGGCNFCPETGSLHPVAIEAAADDKQLRLDPKELSPEKC
jgi:hypothetical protein